MPPAQDALQNRLNSFDRAARTAAVAALAGRPPRAPASPLCVNMHCHTFFSYNGYGASPSAIAARAVADGWYAAGICDFDVLDGMDEFLAAADVLGLRAAANLETRVFFSEYADHEINSPGEPGVYYFMGAGFVRPPTPGSAAEQQLRAMRTGVERRNRGVVERVNACLAPVTLDYDADVLPLTPAGNATERHICTAYFRQGREIFPDAAEAAAFWADRLGVDAAAAAELLADPMAFNDQARSTLMKAGGPGYVKPTRATFPLLDDIITLALACEAVPMATWLDGMRSGEADMETQLRCLMAKGVAALNIIPDRNWNLKDADGQRAKVAKLHDCVAVADRLQLPVNVGTELNKYGQRWVDAFDAPPMRPVAGSFIRGAEIMVGHTRLLRWADVSYVGAAAAAEFGDDTAAKNEVFRAVGALPPPAAAEREKLTSLGADAAYARLRDAASRGRW